LTLASVNLQTPDLCTALAGGEEVSTLRGQTWALKSEDIPEGGDMGRIENAGGSGVGCI